MSTTRPHSGAYTTSDWPGSAAPRPLLQLQLLDDRHQSFPAALLQGTYQLRLRVIDLVIERLNRHFQLVPVVRGRMQRRSQAQGHQRHQIDLDGEEQLAGVLPLPMRLEQRVEPLGAQRPLHQQPGHEGQGALFDEALENGVQG